MKSTRFSVIILPILTLFVGWQLGLNTTIIKGESPDLGTSSQTGSGTVRSNPEKEADISLLWTTWKLLMTHYVHPEELITQKMVQGAVRGMVAAVGDPYTLYMTPKENTEFHDMLDGHLQGIGAELSLTDGIVVIQNVIKESPAEKAGLLPEDKIATIDGKTYENMTLDQIVGKIRGQKGTSVTLTIIRAGEDAPLTFTLIRDDIRVPSTEYETKQTAAGTVGLLTINEFGTDTVREIRTILNGLDQNTIKSLIIDLRYNGGGYLDGAVSLSSMFLKEGNVVTVAGRDDDNEVHAVNGKPILPTIPLVVLINQGSASASEIFAGAMKDHGRATIIGMQSFGKGTVQEILDLPGGGSLRVTIARWLTPNGTDLGKVGITPDIVVDRSIEQIRAKQDPQLDAALEFLATGKVVKVKTGTGSASSGG